MTRSTLEELLARCERAHGPDRDIDAAIVAALNNAVVKPYPPSDDFGPHDHWQFWSSDGAHFLGSEAKFKVPAYSSSLDAIVGLIHEDKHKWGSKVICGFFAGGQVMADQSAQGDSDYDPRARPDNSVTVGWGAHVAFYKPTGGGGSETYGPDGYSHGRTAALALCAAFLRAKLSSPGGDE